MMISAVCLAIATVPLSFGFLIVSFLLTEDR